MAKQGLIRVPFYPQLHCLASLNPHAPLLMSALLFWMSRANEPSYCQKRHDYQLALHLGLSLQSYQECLASLQSCSIFIEHEVVISPKEVTAESKERKEVRLSLDFAKFQALLESLGCSLELKLLMHACDDSFDFYDVIESKFLPTVQELQGYVVGSRYEQVALDFTKFVVWFNEQQHDLALKAIAPGWRLLLEIPQGESIEQYASELVVRFLRPQERAIDFSFADGNFFLPDYAEIKAKRHIVKHYRHKNDSQSLTAAALWLLSTHYPQELKFLSELSVSELKDAIALLRAYEPSINLELSEEYFAARKLSPSEINKEKAKLVELLH